MSDHPRSRGVYASAGNPRRPISGSSPLARGLRVEGAVGEAGCGIIPARAGFTDPAAIFGSPLPDHPRSRGVYSHLVSWAAEPGGSSPLARGLPECGREENPMGTDHPRSRGVYLDAFTALVVQDGIIPARAGFTEALDGQLRELSDHPRSRGVYTLIIRGIHSSTGSSPLARGLQPVADLPQEISGIIPARAGFTSSVMEAIIWSRDHPRSRGVYRASCIDATRMNGIIPARAGFTTGSGMHPGVGRDHPRSRGVYTRLVEGAAQEAGSSPLARGLPGENVLRGYACRIIPARAGFTWTRRRRY